jgi:hypothetical protein
VRNKESYTVKSVFSSIRTWIAGELNGRDGHLVEMEEQLMPHSGNAPSQRVINCKNKWEDQY